MKIAGIFQHKSTRVTQSPHKNSPYDTIRPYPKIDRTKQVKEPETAKFPSIAP